MNYSRPWMLSGLALMAAGVFCLAAGPPTWRPGRSAETLRRRSLPVERTFRRKNLDGWKKTQFGGEGKVDVKDGMIVMEMGSMMTGITWAGEVLRNNYGIRLEGMRLDGSDFFCTTTFPVGKDPCTLVVGGWGGGVVGLSNVDHEDASENATTKSMSFKNKQWYRVRLRVTDAAIEAWIDDEKLVDQPRQRPQVWHPHGVRPEPSAGHFHLGEHRRRA